MKSQSKNIVIPENHCSTQGGNFSDNLSGTSTHLHSEESRKAALQAQSEAKAIREEMDDRMTPAKAMVSRV